MKQELPDPFREFWSHLRNLLECFGRIQDRLDPTRLVEYVDLLEVLARALQSAQASSEFSPVFTSDPTGQILLRSASQSLQAASRFDSARGGSHEILKAFQALRSVARSQEILYDLAGRFDDVSEFFLNPSRIGDTDLLASLRETRAEPDEAGAGKPARGILNFNNERGHRGGYSLYVPEYFTSEKKWPLVVALHGGSGHGGDFLWSWLRDARSSGFILASPTSLDRTWSLRSPGTDAASLNRMLEKISQSYPIDTGRLLLTGISDGGTYAMLLSVVRQSPFTHYAPVAAAVHVLLSDQGSVVRPVDGLRIYQVHGARDWMFPVEHARRAASALDKAGAKIVYREIPDLSHNYPRDENERIIQWFLG